MSKKRADADHRVVLSVRETADTLGIGLNQAYEAIRAKKIPSLRIGQRILVPRVALEKMLDRVA
jgi:excisionase family DNA binding protein